MALPALVTYEIASQHLRINYQNVDGEIVYNVAEKALVESYIDAASEYIRGYCGQDFIDETDPDNPVLNAPASVVQAALLLVGHFYRDREQFVNAAINEYPTVIRLLDQYRVNLGV